MALKLKEIGQFDQTSTVSGSGEEYIAVRKADGKTYKMSTADFKAFLGTVQVQVPRAISPTDPAPTLDGVYEPTAIGSYPNAGGLSVLPTDGYVRFIKNAASWVKVNTPVPDNAPNRNLAPPIKGNIIISETDFSNNSRKFQDFDKVVLSGVAATSHGFAVDNLDGHIENQFNIYLDFKSVFSSQYATARVEVVARLTDDTLVNLGTHNITGNFDGKRLILSGSRTNVVRFGITVYGSEQVRLEIRGLYVGRRSFENDIFIPAVSQFKTVKNIAQGWRLVSTSGTLRALPDSLELSAPGYAQASFETTAPRVYISFKLKQSQVSQARTKIFGWNGSAEVGTATYYAPSISDEFMTFRIDWAVPADQTNFRGLRVEIRNMYGPPIEFKDLIISENPIAEDGIAVGDLTERSVVQEQIAGTVKAYTRGTVALGQNIATRFNFAFFSDVHYYSANSDQNLKELQDFISLPLIRDDISAVFSGGDVCNGTAGRAKAETLAEINAFTSRALQINKPTLNIIGNHDDNVSRTGSANPTTTFVNALSKSEQYNTMIKPFADKWSNVVRVVDKCYYHADFVEHKIRVIATDAYDFPLADNGDGSVKYKGQLGGQYFSQAQIDWLFATLQSTPNDYAVIVLTHAPIKPGLTWGDGFIQGIDLIPAAINAYRTAGTYSHGWTSAQFPELNTAKLFDFTAAQPREFICYLSGHIHAMKYFTIENFPDQHCISVPCMFTGNSGPGLALESPSMNRGDDDETRNSFAIISVDRFLKQLVVTMYGAYRDGQGVVTDRVNFIKYDTE